MAFPGDQSDLHQPRVHREHHRGGRGQVLNSPSDMLHTMFHKLAFADPNTRDDVFFFFKTNEQTNIYYMLYLNIFARVTV